MQTFNLKLVHTVVLIIIKKDSICHNKVILYVQGRYFTTRFGSKGSSTGNTYIKLYFRVTVYL